MNFSNRTLLHGDSLPFLRGMDSETVDLVATDPPFKKGRDFHATPDSLAAGPSSRTGGRGTRMCIPTGSTTSKRTGRASHGSSRRREIAPRDISTACRVLDRARDEGHFLHASIHLIADAGIRLGEALSLQRRNVNFKHVQFLI